MAIAHPSLERDAALALDRADPLAASRDRFVVADPGLVYLDGSSLGRLPSATSDRLEKGGQRAVGREFDPRLVREWLELPVRVGELVARSSERGRDR